VTDLDAWFMSEVLPLEAALTRFIRRNWADAGEVLDLRQEVYARVYDAARRNRPLQTKPFVFTAARNLLIDRARRAQVVKIDTVTDLESLSVPLDEAPADRRLIAREELKRLQDALDRLPPRCREVVSMRKIEGLSQREVARALGITEDTVERQVSNGVRALAEALFGDRMAYGRRAGLRNRSREAGR
jgi:RNA polymerase sigma-70 factor (ECF subfamily)